MHRVGVVVAVCAFIAGCSTPQSPEDKYWNFFLEDPELTQTIRGVGKTQALSIGYQICSVFEEQGRPRGIWASQDALEAAGMPFPENHLVVGSAIDHLCPDK